MTQVRTKRVKAYCGHKQLDGHWVTAEYWCNGGENLTFTHVAPDPTVTSAHHGCWVITNETWTGLYCTNIWCLTELANFDQPCPRCGEEFGPPEDGPHE